MKSPLFSVIIDTYDYGCYIEQAVESVLVQRLDGAECEVIVVDDGSSDDTAERMKRFGAGVTFVRKNNGGQASAFNEGFSRARGALIGMLDGDDVWYQGKLAAVKAVFDSDPDVVVVRHLMDDIDGRGRRTAGAGAPPAVTDDAGLLRLLSSRSHFIGTSALAFRRSALERVLPVPEDLVVCPDEYLCSHLLFFGSMRTIPRALGARRLHERNAGLYGINLLNRKNLLRYAHIRGRLDHYLEQRMLEQHAPLPPSVFAESRFGIVRAQVLAERLEGSFWKAVRRYGAAWKPVPTGFRALMRVLLLSVAVVSPRMYAALYRARAAVGMA